MGEPGTGKPTMGLQFCAEAPGQGQTAMFLTISQDKRDLERIASSHSLPLDEIQVREISALRLAGGPDDRQSVVDTSDAELSDLMSHVRDAVEESGADRIVIDSLFELRLLAGDMLTYRRELLLLRSLIGQIGATALFLDYEDEVMGDRQLEGLANGVIALEKSTPPYGDEVRRLRVLKMRGHDFVEGFHDIDIQKGGVVTYPRVLPQLTSETLSNELIGCGIDELDDMLGGGLQPGTTCLIVGQSGTGKSTLVTAYAQAAAERGKRAAMFLFEERPEILRRRSRDLGFRISQFEEQGMLSLEHYNPAEISPGQFAQAVVRAVEDNGARVVVIDSLTGYLGALPEGQRLITQLHALLSYLSRRDVLTILTMIRPGLLTGDGHSIRADTSYLADSAILLRHEEVESSIRRTITVLKKRHGDHERSIRELRIGGTSVTVGDVPGNEPMTSPDLGIV